MDFLKDVLGEELFSSVSQKITEFNSLNPDKAVKIGDLAGGRYVDRGKYDALEAASNGYKGQLETLQSELEGLKKSKGTEDLQQKLTSLQEKYNTDTERLTKDLEQAKFNAALDLALEKSGAKNTRAVRGLLDLEKLSMKNDELTGLTEQLTAIKEENGYMFNDAKQEPTGMRHTGGGNGIESFVSAARNAAGLKD